ncbi:MAG: T9SS type A sorting domain-containing protein [Candidatus Latescibacteria bacterium]|nr:T9SS type A sorting domain-containing protein [Candidatus Latescibacterota bacterium]
MVILRRYLGTALLLLLSAQAGAAAPVWTVLGPGGGPKRFSFIAVDPQDSLSIYAGSSEGIYQSRNGGEQWQQLSQWGVESLVVDPQDSQVLYARDPQGFYKSADRGSTWRRTDQRIGATPLLFDPADSQVLYAGGSKGIYRSEDRGETWNPLNQGVSVGGLAFDPQDSRVLYAGCEEGLYRSADRGSSWELICTGRFGLLVIDPVDPQLMYADATRWQPHIGESLTTVYKSTDGGKTWAQNGYAPRRATFHALFTCPPGSQSLYAFAGGGLSRSADKALTWEYLSAPYWGMGALGWTPQKPRAFYAGIENATGAEDLNFLTQFIRSADGGDTWQELPLHIPVFAAAQDPEMHTFYVSTDRGIYQTPDAGQQWDQLNTEYRFAALIVDPQDSHRLVAGGQGLYESEDQGRTWTPLSGLGERTVSALLVDTRRPDRFFALADAALFSSADRGITWAVAEGPLGDAPVYTLAAAPDDPQTLYAGTAAGAYKSVDGGATWNPLPIPTGINILAIAAVPPHTMYANAYLAGTGLRRIYRSEDGGMSWSTCTFPPGHRFAMDAPDGRRPPDLVDLLADPRDARALYVSTFQDGFYRSTDQGQTWESFNPGLPLFRDRWPLALYHQIPRFFLPRSSSGFLYAVTDWGLCRIELPSISEPISDPGATSDNNEEEQPAETRSPPLPTITALGQSFPNPFNLQTSTPYQLATSSVVRLEIFDLQGHRVRTIEKGTQPPGFYQEIWHRRDDQGQKLASGVYLVRLQAGSYSAVRKVLLVK